MPKVMKVDEVWAKNGYMVYCPGCESHHVYDERWTYNGDDERPTFTPSYVIGNRGFVCHSWLTDGQFRFLTDSTHELAGKTVPVEDIDR